MPKSSKKLAATKPTARSRITNGGELLPGVDGRSTWARRMRDLIQAHENDLGGTDACSQAQRSIIRRGACLTVELEHLEQRFATDGPAKAQDLDLYQRTANSLRRLLEAVGLQRVPRDITPDLAEYLEAHDEHH